MLSKCPLDTYAYYDESGDRHLVFGHEDYVRLARHLCYLAILRHLDR